MMHIEEREKKVLDNLGLVHHMVKRYLGRGYEGEELFQIGVLGLLKAVDYFDEQRNVKFSTYAVPMIMGEITRFLRTNGSLKVSRGLKEKAYQIYLKREEIIEKTGKEPTLEELAELLGLTREQILEVNESTYEVASLYQTKKEADGSERMLIDRIASEEVPQEKLVDTLALKEVFHTLTGEEKRILWQRYFENKTQAEVAKMFAITQVQVSRKEKKILLQMRDKLTDD